MDNDNTVNRHEYEDGREKLSKVLDDFENDYKTTHPDKNVHFQAVYFRYDKTLEKVWGYSELGKKLQPEQMNKFREEFNPTNGDMGVTTYSPIEIDEYKPLFMTRDPRTLGIDRKLDGVYEVDFSAQEDGRMAGFIKGKRGYDYRFKFVPDSAWQRFSVPLISGDKYRVLVTNTAGPKGGIHFCIPVECTFSQKQMDEKFAMARADALARGVRLVKLVSDNQQGSIFIDEYSGRDSLASAYIGDIESRSHFVEQIDVFGSSYPGVFGGTKLIEISEDDYQKLKRIKDRFNKVKPELEEMIKKAESVRPNSEEFNPLKQKIIDLALENGVGAHLGDIAGELFWDLRIGKAAIAESEDKFN